MQLELFDEASGGHMENPGNATTESTCHIILYGVAGNTQHCLSRRLKLISATPRLALVTAETGSWL